MIIAGTGSRSLQLEPVSFKRVIFDATVKALSLKRPDLVLSGMAEGFDTCIAAAAIKLGIPFDAILPTANYGSYYWRSHSVTGTNRYDEFENYIRQARDVIVVSEELYVNGVHANFVRNQYLVDHSNHMLVYNPESLGTRDCLNRINQARRPYSLLTLENEV